MLAHLLDTIRDISDKEYQRRVWIRGEGPEVDDFTETVCCFFDMGDPVLDDYKSLEITENQYRILKYFRDEFEKFADSNDFPELFIDTAEWTKITLMANRILVLFNYCKYIVLYRN